MEQYNICLWCGKKINKLDGNHIYRCEKRPKELTNAEVRLKYIAYKLNADENIIQNIINDYINLYSLPMLYNKYGIDYKSVYFILNYYNIPIRSISESAKLISQDKFKKTCLKKYGCENISQAKQIKQKKEETFLKHYGVNNVWKLSDYNKKCAELHPESHAEHMKKTHAGRDKYFENITEEEMQNRIKKIYYMQVNNNVYNSSLELRLCNIFEKLNISYTRQFHINGYRHPYDFNLYKSKIIIEVNGDFWHANPIIYNENDIVKLPGRPTLAKDIWEADKKHINKANENGFKVISIWETEIRKRNDDELAEYILELLKNI